MRPFLRRAGTRLTAAREAARVAIARGAAHRAVPAHGGPRPAGLRPCLRGDETDEQGNLPFQGLLFRIRRQFFLFAFHGAPSTHRRSCRHEMVFLSPRLHCAERRTAILPGGYVDVLRRERHYPPVCRSSPDHSSGPFGKNRGRRKYVSSLWNREK